MIRGALLPTDSPVDYILDESEDNVWVEVGALVVRIARNGDDVRVEVFPAHNTSGEPLAACEAGGAA